MIDLVLWTSIIGGTVIGATVVELKIKKNKKVEEERGKYDKRYKKINGVDLSKVKEIVDRKTNEILKEDKVSLREKESVKSIIYKKVTDEIFKEI
ncbi:MAG: hypothetical protein ACRDDY_08220 [Clostridium sp.]|uniref:hypothetical protein n=1 Tax=Clostridium sp. TaxID=1506 RepID=UPI003EE77053